MAIPLVLLPGAGLPVAVAYPALLDELADEVDALPKDLQLFAEEEPPPGYTMDLEVQALREAVDAAGWDQFHLLGYSAGGAISLAFAASYPQRLSSLALVEPAWAGNDGLGPEESRVWQQLNLIMDLPIPERMGSFRRLHLRPGVDPPPPDPGPEPSWMARRPRGLPVLVKAFRSTELDLDGLRAVSAPTYLAVGGLSNPDYFVRQADRLALILPRCEVEVYEERHHFDTPQHAEPQRLAHALRRLWARA